MNKILILVAHSNNTIRERLFLEITEAIKMLDIINQNDIKLKCISGNENPLEWALNKVRSLKKILKEVIIVSSITLENIPEFDGKGGLFSYEFFNTLEKTFPKIKFKHIIGSGLLEEQDPAPILVFPAISLPLFLSPSIKLPVFTLTRTLPKKRLFLRYHFSEASFEFSIQKNRQEQIRALLVA